MPKPIRIDNWFTTYGDPARIDPYTPPEFIKLYLGGDVTDHPRKNGNHAVITSSIVKAEGRMVTTSSGSVYRLGKIDPKFRKWLRENRPDWDHKNPIRMIRITERTKKGKQNGNPDPNS